MTESWWFNLLVTLLIIAASGFFVIIEFSLICLLYTSDAADD